MTTIDALQADYRRQTPPPGLQAEALARFEQHRQHPTSFWPQTWLSAGATAMLVIGIVLLARQQPAPEPVPMSPWSLSRLTTSATLHGSMPVPHVTGQPLSSLTRGTGALAGTTRFNVTAGNRPAQSTAPGSHSKEKLK